MMHESRSYLSDECIHIKKNSEISNIYVLFNFSQLMDENSLEGCKYSSIAQKIIQHSLKLDDSNRLHTSCWLRQGEFALDFDFHSFQRD